MYIYSPNIVNDVDTSGILLLEYDNFKVVCIAAKDTFNNSYVNIQGDQGIIKSYWSYQMKFLITVFKQKITL